MNRRNMELTNLDESFMFHGENGYFNKKIYNISGEKKHRLFKINIVFEDAPGLDTFAMRDDLESKIKSFKRLRGDF